MNTIEDFTKYINDHGYMDGSNFELVACEYIKDNCEVTDLAFLMKHLGKIYANKLSYISKKTHELQEIFHTAAKLDDTPDTLKRIYSKLEDDMIILNSAYAGKEEG